MKVLKHIRKRAKRCYELAAKAVVMSKDDPEAVGAKLVHGIVHYREFGGAPIGHAWVMLADGRVYDPTRNQYYAASEYERTFGAITERTYTKKQAARRTATEGHWGPWHETERPRRTKEGERVPSRVWWNFPDSALRRL